MTFILFSLLLCLLNCIFTIKEIHLEETSTQNYEEKYQSQNENPLVPHSNENFQPAKDFFSNKFYSHIRNKREIDPRLHTCYLDSNSANQYYGYIFKTKKPCREIRKQSLNSERGRDKNDMELGNRRFTDIAGAQRHIGGYPLRPYPKISPHTRSLSIRKRVNHPEFKLTSTYHIRNKFDEKSYSNDAMKYQFRRGDRHKNQTNEPESIALKHNIVSPIAKSKSMISGPEKSLDLIFHPTHLVNSTEHNSTDCSNFQNKKYNGSEKNDPNPFSHLKEIEALMISLNKMEFQSFYEQNIILLIFAVSFIFLLFACFCCFCKRSQAKDDATLFLIQPTKCSTQNSSPIEQNASSIKTIISSSQNRMDKSPGVIIQSQPYDSKSDESDLCTSHRKRRLKRKPGKGYKKIKNVCCAYEKHDEGQCVIPKNVYGAHRYELSKDQENKCNIYQHNSWCETYYSDPTSISTKIKSDSQCSRCINHEIKEIFRQDPNYLFQLASSMDLNFQNNYNNVKKIDTNVESYAETATSSAMSRFKVVRPNIKRSKIKKKIRR